MSRLERWTRVEMSGEVGIYKHAVYDVDTDRVTWYEEEAEAQAHLRLGHPTGPPTSVGSRIENSQDHLPPHDHTIETGEINRRGCKRCEIEAASRIANSQEGSEGSP